MAATYIGRLVERETPSGLLMAWLRCLLILRSGLFRLAGNCAGKVDMRGFPAAAWQTILEKRGDSR